MGSYGTEKPLFMRLWCSSAHDRSGRASECKPVPKRDFTYSRIGQDRAQLGTNLGLSGSKPVATGRRFGSQVAVCLIAVAFFVAFLGPLFAVGAFAKCSTHKCWARVSAKRHAHFWPRKLHAQPQGWQAWAWSTSGCESNHRRVARESGFYSYFQWTLQTWHVAGGRGNPEQHSYEEQAVKAIRYARRYGTGAWPVCGH